MLGGIALGREAISLRLVAVGAVVVLLVRPEALAEPSFQFSFAAVTAIIALHSSSWGRQVLTRRDEGPGARTARSLLSLVLTGLVVEFALIPFALFHFHKAGLFGVAANLVAIPLTTFAIMPLEAGALFLDIAGLGAPLWWAAGHSLSGLLWIAHEVASAKGAVTTLSAMPLWAFGLMVLGGLWLCLWSTRARLLGFVLFVIGAGAAAMTPNPDLLITGDGRHLAVIALNGMPMMLRDRSGDFMRDLMSEASGFDDEPGLLAAAPFGACSRDACVGRISQDGREYRLLATRSMTRIDWQSLVKACGCRHRGVRALAAQGLRAAMAEARSQGARADWRGRYPPWARPWRRYGFRTSWPPSVGTDGERKISYAARPRKGETVNASVCN